MSGFEDLLRDQRRQRPLRVQPTPSHDLREQVSRYKHALEIIRDAEGLEAEALRTIAYAVVGPRIVVTPPEGEASP